MKNMAMLTDFPFINPRNVSLYRTVCPIYMPSSTPFPKAEKGISIIYLKGAGNPQHI